MTPDRGLPEALGEELSADDLKMLGSSFITPALAIQAGLRRVHALDGARIVGRSKAAYSGIVFPYYWPGDSHCVALRLRRDQPDVEYTAEGRKEVRKYLSAPGSINRLYLVRGTDPAQLQNADVPIVFTEGEKKTLALSRLSDQGLLAVGLAGVSNWRGTIGKEVGPTGERLDVKGPIPDLLRINLDQRITFIAFDRDTATNWNVRIARWKFAEYLIHERRARVRYVSIPPESGVKGIDDLLCSLGSCARLGTF